jgi:hypothetical protein
VVTLAKSSIWDYESYLEVENRSCNPSEFTKKAQKLLTQHNFDHKHSVRHHIKKDCNNDVITFKRMTQLRSQKFDKIKI